MELTRAQETQLRRTGREAMEKVIAAAQQATQNGIQRATAKVTAVNDDCTADVDFGTTDYPMPLTGLRYTTGCCSMQVGDRVLVDTVNNQPLITGILANSDNGPYVRSGTLYESGDGYIRWGQQGHIVAVWANYIHAEPSIVKYGPLPKEARPAVEALGCGYVRGEAGSDGQVVVDPEGYVGIYCTRTSNYFSGSVAYFVA